MNDYLQRYPRPYGTNIGDVWSAEDSTVGRMLLAKGLILLHEVLADADGNPEERLYNVELSNPDLAVQDLIRQAREGTKLWIAAQARRN